MKRFTPILLALITFISVTGYFVWGIPYAYAAAIALDGSVVTSQNTATNAITVANNTNRMLVLEYTSYQGSALTSATYNSVSMTKVAEQIGSFNENSSVWVLVAPSTGTNNVVLTGASSFYAIGILSLYNVDQNNPTTVNNCTNNNGTETCALTTDTANSWVVGSLEAEPLQTMTTTNGVEDWNQSGQSFQHGEGQHIVTTSATSYTVSASLAYGARWNESLVQIKPVATAVFHASAVAGKASVVTGKSTVITN